MCERSDRRKGKRKRNAREKCKDYDRKKRGDVKSLKKISEEKESK